MENDKEQKKDEQTNQLDSTGSPQEIKKGL
jgi:hypothetical protein